MRIVLEFLSVASTALVKVSLVFGDHSVDFEGGFHYLKFLVMYFN